MRIRSLHKGGNRAYADAMRVLVGENDPLVRELAVAGLEDAGFEGGWRRGALRLLQTRIAIDTVSTDIRPPAANG